MATHGPKDCRGIGKYDCEFDEKVHGYTLEDFGGHGNVEAPSGWFSPLTLDAEDPADAGLIEHYGSPYLVVREDNNGFVFVAALADGDLQQTAVDLLMEQFNEWDDQDEDQL